MPTAERLGRSLDADGTVVGYAGEWYSLPLRDALFMGALVCNKAVNMVQAICVAEFSSTPCICRCTNSSLKSGGATSLIREDAGGAADFVFNMLYNPGRLFSAIGSLFLCCAG